MRVFEKTVWVLTLGLMLGASEVSAEGKHPPTTHPGENPGLLGGPQIHDEGSAKNSPGQHRKPGEFMDKVLKELNLSDEQKAKIKAIRDQSREERLKFMAEHKAEREKFHQQFKAARESGDKERMKELADQMRAAREKNGHNPKAMMEKVKKVLTEEQAQKFEDQIKSKREKVKNKSEGRRGKKGLEDGNDPEKKPRKRPEHPHKGKRPRGDDDKDNGPHRGHRGPSPDGDGDELPPPPPGEGEPIDF